MQERFNITLPLPLGANLVKEQTESHNQLWQSISTADIECSMTIPIEAIMRDHSKGQINKLPIKSKQFTNNLIQIILDSNGSEQFEESKENEIQYNFFPFEVSLRLTNQTLLIKINKLSVNFKLTQIPKPKFVKNQLLLSLNKLNRDDWGLLTMDQSHRVVFEKQSTQFPVIGFWCLGKSTNQLKSLKELADYCEMRFKKKCKFMQQGKKYFYMARCSHETKTPELFLVQWKSSKEEIINFDYSINDIKTKYEIVLRSDEHSYLEFTLRTDEKIPKVLDGIQESPILFKTECTLDSPFVKEKKLKQPDSPRFKCATLKPSFQQLQYTQLKKLVKKQQQQISELKTALQRVTFSLEQTKATSVKQPHQIRLKELKGLTESDLSLNSQSEGPSTNTSTNSLAQGQIYFEGFRILGK